MKKLHFLLIPSLMIAFPLIGLLPPAWQGVAEIKTILEDPSLKNYLKSGDVIEDISRSDKGWTIHTNHSEIQAEVLPVMQERPGPQKFNLKFSLLQAEPIPQ